jgi:hypothetical protein
MALKPEISLGASLAVMALDFGIFQLNMPVLADVKSADPHNSSVESSRVGATWTAVSACAALSLLAKDPNIFIFGGGFAVALSWFYTHANMTHPGTGQVTYPPAGGPVPGGVNASGS